MYPVPLHQLAPHRLFRGLPWLDTTRWQMQDRPPQRQWTRHVGITISSSTLIASQAEVDFSSRNRVVLIRGNGTTQQGRPNGR